jgi:hypothetical protein
MHCWWVTSFNIFIHDVLHMHLSAGLTHLLIHGHQQLDAGCLGLKLQTNRPVLTPYFYNHKTATKRPLIQILYLFSLSSNHGFCMGMFCKGSIFCVSYMQIHFLTSLITVTMKVWTVTAMSPQPVHVKNCYLLLGHWPHNFHTHVSSH